MKKYLYYIIICMMGTLFLTDRIFSECQSIQITDSELIEDSKPQINNGMIVWEASGGTLGDDGEIFVWDGEKTIRLTDDENDDAYPVINNGQVAWISWIDDLNIDINLWDGNSIINIAQQVNVYPFLDIDNGYIVWSASDGNDAEIFLWHEGTIMQITNNDITDFSPRISNGQIAWVGFVNIYDDFEIYFWDGSSIQQITDNEIDDKNPDIYNGQITWKGMAKGAPNESDIYFWDGMDITQITHNTDYYAWDPQIYNGQITWYGWSVIGNDRSEIFFWDGNVVTQLTDNNIEDLADEYPKIHNGQIVWNACDSVQCDIYFWDGASIIQITDSPSIEAAAMINNGQIVWVGNYGQDDDIFLCNEYAYPVPEITGYFPIFMLSSISLLLCKRKVLQK